MDDASRLTRNDTLMSAPVDDDIVFLNPQSDNYVALDAIGRRIWNLLAEPTTLGHIDARLAQEFDGDTGQIRADVEAFIDELVTEDMVRVT